MIDQEWLDELEERLSTLHKRDCLLGAGIITDDGHWVPGDRTEEPLSLETITSIISFYRHREPIIGRYK